MLRLTPILLAVLYAYALYHFSVWRTRAELTARSSPLAEPGLTPVTARLARALGVAEVPVLVYDIDPVNGLAAPDGRIFITRGFLQEYRAGRVTAEELASVIAHELGHVALGHTRRRWIDFTGQNAVRMALGALLSRFLPGIGLWLANLVTSLIAARLSRDDEYAADAWASALLIKAGIGTEPQKALFAKLGQLTGTGASAPAWLLSHPRTEDRIAAIAAQEARWRGR